MPVRAYFVTLETRDSFDADAYTRVAGQLTNAFQASLGNMDTFRSVTHCADAADARVEIEVSQADASNPSSPVVARAIVQAHTAGKMAFDKSMFTSIVREMLPFGVAISKRAVPPEDMAVEEPA